MQLAFNSDVSFAPAKHNFSDAKLYLFSALFAAGNLLLPMAVHAIPQGGLVFLPLFFFTLVAAYAEGLNAGILVALASPLINHAVTGMPGSAMLPVVLIKSLFLAAAAAAAAQRLGKLSLLALASLATSIQALGLLAEWGFSSSLAQAWHSACLGIPGIALMALGSYSLLRWMAKGRQQGGAR